MTPSDRLRDLGDRVAETLRRSPAADLERNLRALIESFADRFNLVAREDFELERDLLRKALDQIAELEKRIADLEKGESEIASRAAS